MTDKLFPIPGQWSVKNHKRLPYFNIPWDMIASHEAQAQANHYQTLERLAQRGGLSADEAIAVIEDRKWTDMDIDDAHEKLTKMTAEFKKNN